MDNKIKILFLDHQAELGGAEISLLNTLRFLDKQRFKPIVLLGSQGPFKERLDKINVDTYIIDIPNYLRTLKRDPARENSFISIIKSAFAIPRVIKKIEKFIYDNNIDILFANTVKAACLGIPAATKAGIKSCWRVRDILTRDFYKGYLLKAIHILTKDTDELICVSEAVIKALEYGATGKKESVVYNGVVIREDVDVEEFKMGSNMDEIKEELLLEVQYVVSLIGRLEPWKGQDVFIRAAKIASKQIPNMKFLIVGGALFKRQDCEMAYKKLIKELSLEDKVILLGFRNDIPQIISTSDIIVHPSTKPEPFGRDIIEAMACGKPVIATDIGGPKELITPDTGILIEPNRPDILADEIIKLINDTERMKSLGRNGRKRAEEVFDIKKTTRHLEDILSEVAKRP